MIDSSFDDRDSAQLLVKAGGDSDSMARLTGFVSMLQHAEVSFEALRFLPSLDVCRQRCQVALSTDVLEAGSVRLVICST